MNMSPVVVLTTIAAIASAAAAGMMYVFSTFVMRGLDRTGPINAITAMRGINVAANSNGAFLLAYLGASVLAIAVGVVAVVQIGRPGSGWLLAGAIFGVLGALITIAFNVPLNNHLDTVDPAGLSVAEAAGEWQAYFAHVDGVEPRPHRHSDRRSRADADRRAVPLARRREAATVLRGGRGHRHRLLHRRSWRRTPLRRRGAPRRRWRLRRLHGLGSQPLQLAAVPLGQHRGQHELRRRARRRRWRDLRDHLAGDAVRHLVADLRVQLRCAGEELARQLGLLRAAARTAAATTPTTPARRHQRRRRQLRRRAR